MKALNEKEMRAIDGGVTYVTKCGCRMKFKDTVSGLAKAAAHKLFCSEARMIAKKNKKGIYWTFA